MAEAPVVSPITDSVVYKPLVDLLAVTFGPVAILRTRFGRRALVSNEPSFTVPGLPDVPSSREQCQRTSTCLLLVARIGTRWLMCSLTPKSCSSVKSTFAVSLLDAWAHDDRSFKKTILARPLVDVIRNNDE